MSYRRAPNTRHDTGEEMMHGSDLKKLCKDLKITQKHMAQEMGLKLVQLRFWWRTKSPRLEGWHEMLLRTKCKNKGLDPKKYNL